jgi:uncharacterized membrane protein
LGNPQPQSSPLLTAVFTDVSSSMSKHGLWLIAGASAAQLVFADISPPSVAIFCQVTCVSGWPLASSSIVLLLFALIEFPFAAKSLLEALSQKSEQFFRGPELQSVAGIHFFHRPFELAS